jgi:hypothetical protein
LSFRRFLDFRSRPFLVDLRHGRFFDIRT